ncbi:MAG: hypothetical protein R3C44_05730 [Chloroflexota bacterium]
MNEQEKMEILELLASQKITAQEAADMLRQASVPDVESPSKRKLSGRPMSR